MDCRLRTRQESGWVVGQAVVVGKSIVRDSCRNACVSYLEEKKEKNILCLGQCYGQAFGTACGSSGE